MCFTSVNLIWWLFARALSLWLMCLDSVFRQWLRVIFLSTLQVLIICVTLNAVLQITTSLCGKICKTTAMTIVMAILKPFIQFDLPVHSTKTVLFNTGITLVHSCSDWCTAVDQVTHLLMILCHLNRSYTQPHQLVLNLKSMCQLWLCACALSLWLQLISSANSVFVTSHSECSVLILFFSWICQLTLSPSTWMHWYSIDCCTAMCQTPIHDADPVSPSYFILYTLLRCSIPTQLLCVNSFHSPSTISLCLCFVTLIILRLMHFCASNSKLAAVPASP